MVDRDAVTYYAKLAGHVIFWGSIGAIAVALIVGLF
jgi:hypothetical protein